MYNIIKYQPSEYGSYRFPAWAEILGILMGVLSCLMIPVGMVVAVLREEGTLWEVGCSGAQNCWGEPQKCAGVTTSPCQACISWKFLHSLSWRCVSPSLLAAHRVWEMTYPRDFNCVPSQDAKQARSQAHPLTKTHLTWLASWGSTLSPAWVGRDMWDFAPILQEQ